MDTKLFEDHALTSERLLEFLNLIVPTHGLIFGRGSPRRVVNLAQEEGCIDPTEDNDRRSSNKSKGVGHDELLLLDRAVGALRARSRCPRLRPGLVATEKIVDGRVDTLGLKVVPDPGVFCCTSLPRFQQGVCIWFGH